MKRWARWWRWMSGAAISVALAGCAPWAARDVLIEPPKQFVLEAAPELAALREPRLPTIAVMPMQSAPGLDSARMLFVRRPQQLEAFGYHRWADLPARMITVQMVRALERRGAFQAVLAPGSGLPARLRLYADLIHLQQEFLERPSRVHLTVRVQLVDAAERVVLGARTFEYREPAASDDPASGARAAQAALQRFLEDLVVFCEEAGGR